MEEQSNHIRTVSKQKGKICRTSFPEHGDIQFSGPYTAITVTKSPADDFTASAHEWAHLQSGMNGSEYRDPTYHC